MSAKLMAEVLELDVDSATGWLLMGLARHAHDDGSHVHPGVDRLVHYTNKSRRWVQQRLARLRTAGVLEVVGYAGGGRGLATEYHLHLDRVPRRTPFVRRSARTAAVVPPNDAESASFPPGKGRSPRRERAQDSTEKGARQPAPQGSGMFSGRESDARTPTASRTCPDTWPALLADNGANCAAPPTAWTHVTAYYAGREMTDAEWRGTLVRWAMRHDQYGCPCGHPGGGRLGPTRVDGRVEVKPWTAPQEPVDEGDGRGRDLFDQVHAAMQSRVGSAG